MTRRGVLVLLLATSLCGCRLPWWPAECPGVLLPTEQIAGDFLLRPRIRLHAGDTEAALQLAVEKTGTRLVVVGFDPLGAKVFSIVQWGEEVDVESLPGPALAMAPLNVLRDLHRVRFLALEPPPDGDGRVSASFDGTRVSEDWSQGRLLRRRFERPADDRAGAVQLDFDAGEVRIDNPSCGYRAVWSHAEAEP